MINLVMDADLKSVFNSTMIHDVMHKDVITAREDDEVSEAYEIIIKNRLTHLCLVNTRDQLVGIVTPKYAFRTQSPRRILGFGEEEIEYSKDVLVDGDSFYLKTTLNDLVLRNIMTRNPFTMTADQTLAQAVKNMKDRHVGCIPVVDAEKRIKGLLTEREIIRFLVREFKG